MRPTRPTRRSAFAILVIAALLLLGTAAGKLRFEKCIGDCAVATAASCCGEASAAHASDDDAVCSCCCKRAARSKRHLGASQLHGHLHAGGDVARRMQRAPCCVTVALGELGFGPIDVELPNVPPVLLPPPMSAKLPRPPVDAASALVLPFERGPPRVDARTLLRASTVLLI